ncbi:MAG: hypothetical protein IK130_07390 [Oscillospiraceae bacterium]|nr:hypothetical protein [Oscillospiraceae bacterium]
MKPEHLLDAMEHIAPDLIEEAKPAPLAPVSDDQQDEPVCVTGKEKTMKPIQFILTGVSIAAAAAVCAGIGVFISKSKGANDLKDPGDSVTTTAVTEVTGTNGPTESTSIMPERNFLGGIGTLTFQQCGPDTLAEDLTAWYLLNDITVRKSQTNSNPQYVKIDEERDNDTNVQYFADCFEDQSNLYLAARDNVNYSIRLYQVPEDGDSTLKYELPSLTMDYDESKYSLVNTWIQIRDLHIDEEKENSYIDILTFDILHPNDDSPNVTHYWSIHQLLPDGELQRSEFDSKEAFDAAVNGTEENRTLAWAPDYRYYIQDGNYVKRSWDADEPTVYPIVQNAEFDQVVQTEFNGGIYAMSKDGKTIWKSDMDWKYPQVVWTSDNPDNAWCTGNVNEPTDPAVGEKLIGVFNGKVWVRCRHHLILIDTGTYEATYCYDSSVVPLSECSANKTEPADQTEPDDEKRTVAGFACAAFGEWLHVQCGENNGDMNHVSDNKNLAAYLNYSALQYRNQLHIDRWYSQLDNMNIKESGSYQGSPVYTVTGTGTYKDEDGGSGAFGDFTFIIKETASGYTLLEMTHYTMDTVDQLNRPELQGKERADFWDDPACYEPLMKKLNIRMASEGEKISYTLSGHICFSINDIITEYDGKQLSKGIVRYELYQCTPEIMTLPLDICRKLKSLPQWTVEFKDFNVEENMSDTLLQKDQGGRWWIDLDALLTRYTEKAIIRESTADEYGTACDVLDIQNVRPGGWIYTPDAWMTYPDDCSTQKEDSFTAEFVKGYENDYFHQEYKCTVESIMINRDGKFEVLLAYPGVYEKLEPGKKYLFSYDYDIIEMAEPV